LDWPICAGVTGLSRKGQNGWARKSVQPRIFGELGDIGLGDASRKYYVFLRAALVFECRAPRRISALAAAAGGTEGEELFSVAGLAAGIKVSLDAFEVGAKFCAV